jgi:hypothetical protein
MTYKQIETSRELRLWLGQIIIPVVGVVLMVPEAREAVVKNIKIIKKNIETKFNKN